MRQLLSTNYSAPAFNVGILLLRITFGVFMMMSGYDKLIHFGEMKNEFMNFMGMGSTISLMLVVFAEFFCALFVILGLFTRLSCIPLIITMTVALVKAHGGDVLGKGQHAAIYLAIFLFIALVGPGKASVDGVSGR